MFRSVRVLHRWIGVTASLFMVLMAGTGLLLAIKKQFPWIQPQTNVGQKLASMNEVAPLAEIARVALAQGIPELNSTSDFDRFELHVDKGIFKVTSKKGYHEVQVEAKSGRVLSVAKRNDQLVERIHDMSFFSPLMHDWLLPVIALALLTLGLTGTYMFFVPVYRRWRFRKKNYVR